MSLVDVRPAERVATFTAIAALLASTAGHTMLETARDALFLAKLPASTLPWMYLSIAALGLILTRLIPARKTSSTASVAMLVAAVVAIVFWVFLGSPSKGGLYALFIWTGTFGAIVNVELWLLLGGAFDVGQAKRLFGLIGAGAVLGATLGAFVARLVAKNLGARQLLVGASVAFVLAFLPTLTLERKVAKIVSGLDDGKPLAKPSLLADLRVTLKDKYLSRIGLFLVLGTITLAIGDYIFKASMAETFPKEGLATAFATAYLAFNGASLLVQVGLTSALLRVLGVKRALYVLPLLVLLGSGGVVVVPALFAAAALRSTDGALRHSLHKTASELLFLPLLDADRRRAKPVLDLIAQRGGQAAAAVGVLVLVTLGVRTRGLAIVAAAFALGWVAMAGQVGAPYVDAFRKRLRKGAIEIDERIPELDLGALEALFSALNSSKDAEVMGALELLAAQGRSRLIPALVLYHPSKDVVLRALSLLVESGRDDFLPIARRLLDSSDPEIRAAALRARAEVAKDAEELRTLLDDERPEMRANAVVALAAMGAIDAERAHVELTGMLKHDDPVIVVSVIRAMGARPSPRFIDGLVTATRDGATGAVRSEAASALGKVLAAFGDDADEAMQALLVLLPLREEGAGAREAFETIGEPAIAFLDRYLASPDGRGPNAWGAVRALAGFDAERVVPLLLGHLARSADGVVRYRCMRYLKRIRAENPTIAMDTAPLTGVARQTMKQALELLELKLLVEKAQADAQPTAASQLLVTLLEDKRANAMGRVFMLLGLLHPAEDFDRVARGLSSSDNRIRASSRELCQNIVGPELRELVSTLIEDLDDESRLDRALGKERRKLVSNEELILDLAGRSGELGALARYRAKELGVDVGDGPRQDGGEQSAFTDKVIVAVPRKVPVEGHATV